MRSTARKNSGFTLIELLVVVSIIALLISLLLPALSGVRRKANEQSDLADMRQHAIGAASYSSSNRDRLFNAPPAPAGDTQISDLLGPQGSPSQYIAFQDLFETNGWAFPQGMLTFLQFNPVEYDADFADAQLWDFYIPVLGEFMVEGEGMQMLQDVFLGASDRNGKTNWQEFQDDVREQQGRLPTVSGGGDDRSEEFRVGSYRYALPGMISPRCFNENESNDAYDSLREAFRGRNLFPQYITYNSAANVSFPDLKVMFYGFADLGNDVTWNTLAGGSTLVGSAAEAPSVIRVATSSQDGSAKATERGDLVLPDADQNAGWIQDIGNLPFMLTHGGIKGRDLQ